MRYLITDGCGGRVETDSREDAFDLATLMDHIYERQDDGRYVQIH